MTYTRIPDDSSWLEQANCRGHDPELFNVYPAMGSPRWKVYLRPEVQQALALCDACPVRKECAAHVVRAPSHADIIAGGRVYLAGAVVRVRCARGHTLGEGDYYERPSGQRECRRCRGMRQEGLRRARRTKLLQEEGAA